MSVSDTFRQPSNALVKALLEFLDAPTKEEAAIVLERNKALLLTDAAVKLLKNFYWEQMREDLQQCMYEPGYIVYHYSVLAASILYGIPKGWEEVEKQFVAPLRTTREALNRSMWKLE